MTELMAQAISALVEEQFARNQDTILDNIFSGTDETMTQEQIYAKMIANSTKLSVVMSVQIMSELLINSKVISPAGEAQLRKTLLSVVKD